MTSARLASPPASSNSWARPTPGKPSSKEERAYRLRSGPRSLLASKLDEHRIHDPAKPPCHTPNAQLRLAAREAWP